MAKPKVTPWFPGDVLPARPGVYERRYGAYAAEIGYARWDGVRWYFRSWSVEEAEIMSTQSNFSRREWRGLAEQPK